MMIFYLIFLEKNRLLILLIPRLIFTKIEKITLSFYNEIIIIIILYTIIIILLL